MKFSEKVYELCKKIPPGKVSTYRAIGDKLNTKAYQAVGQALRHNPFAPNVPCHRVVNSKGELHGFGGKTSGKKLKDKQKLLESEGIKILNNKVLDFDKNLHNF